LVSLCCKKKVKKQKPAVVEVHEAAPEVEAPVREEPLVERGDVKVWREQPVIRENRGDVRYGDRVLVETRYMSPGREARVERHDHTDWAKYSQAHWHEH